MSEWNYFAAGILLMIGVIAGWLIVRLQHRSKVQEYRLSLQKSDIEALIKQVAALEKRMDIFNGASRHGKEHWQWNAKAGTEHLALLLVQKIEAEEASLALSKTILGTAIEVRKGEFDPEKTMKEYQREDENL